MRRRFDFIVLLLPLFFLLFVVSCASVVGPEVDEPESTVEDNRSAKVSDILSPKITVIVDSINDFAGIDVSSKGDVVWITEEIINNGRFIEINLDLGTIKPLITGLNQPNEFVVRGSDVYIAGNIGNPVSLMQSDLNTGNTMAISDELGGGLSGVDINSDLSSAYVVHFGQGFLAHVDIDQSSSSFKNITKIAEGLDTPRAVVINPDETFAFITEQNAGRLVKVNIDSDTTGYGEVIVINFGLNGPRGLTLNKTGDYVYLAEEFGEKLLKINVNSDSAQHGKIETITEGLILRDVVLSPDEKIALVTDTRLGLVFIDLNPESSSYKKIIKNIRAQLDGARGLWINNKQTYAYIVSEFSGELSRVEIDPLSPNYGQVTLIATGLDIPVDLLVDQNELNAYVAREQSPNRGINAVCRVDLSTGEVFTLTESVGQPVNLCFTNDKKGFYIVDHNGAVHKLSIEDGELTKGIITGLKNPYGLGLAPDGETAYITTESATKVNIPGNLVKANLKSGEVEVLAADIIDGATSVFINRDGTRAYFTQFGAEDDSTGKLSMVDIDPLSPSYLVVTDILTELFEPHDLFVSEDEHQFYLTLVGGRQLLRVDLE
jgi:DNA-binding beta-propeller fold protein YncE